MSQHYHPNLDYTLPHVFKLETFNHATECSFYK